MWEIKGKDNQVKATVGSLEYNGEWMGESYVTVTVESPAPVNFEIGDYIIYRDERFEINYDPGKIKSAPRYEKGDAFKYENIKFNSLADELTRCDFRDVVLQDNNLHFTSLPKFPFYGGVKDLANRIQANLDKLYTGANKWTVIVSPEFQDDKELNVQIDNIKVQGALEILVNQFETYYTISGRTITIGAAGIPAGHLFKYGKGNGLYEIEQNAEADQAIVTRVRAYGSTRNLPHRYYNSLSGADGKKLIPDNMAVQYLMLPEFPYTTQDPYIDSPNIAKLGIREDSVSFDGSGELEEIYPSIEGMTAEQLKAAGVPCNSTGALDEIVSAEQMTDNGVGEINEGETQTTAKPPTFKVTLKDLGFDINDHKTTETATISFKTGMLGGRDFEIVGCKKIESGGKVTGYELELNRVYDDGIKLWFPYSAYNAQAGDKFVILYIEMPEVYIKAAAQRLKEAATEWLSKNDYSRSIYAPKVDEIFMARQHDLAMASGGKIKSLHDTLKEGMLLLFEDEDLNIDASIFIDRLTIKEEGAVPTYEVVLKEEKTVGTLQKMQNKIDSLAAGMGQGGGGYNASQIRSMIDAYGSARFLSKLKNDRSKGQIASDKAIEVGNFLAGASGAKIGKDDKTGQTFGEMDKLFVRVKAYFETLTVINSEALAGEQRITPGGGIKCTSVGENGLIEITKERPMLGEDGNPILDEEGNPVLEEYTELVDNGIPENVFRCFFLSEQDGEKTETKIIAGDQVIAQVFNAKTGTENKIGNRRYWRLVTGVNNDVYTDESGNHYGYIDLSKDDCEADSDIPQAGDDIVQFGNRNDHSRQAAMVFSTVQADAPSIKLFTDIGSGNNNAEHYTIIGRDIVSYGYDHVKGNAYFNCYGDTYIGSKDGSTFIKYDKEQKRLDIKAQLSIDSTIGDKSIEDYIREVAPPVAMEDIEDFVNAIVNPKLDGIQDQIDGVIENWFANGAPALTNYPASDWATVADKEKHLGDLYFDNQTGLAYRFSKDPAGAYYWNDKVDSATAAALAAAARAQDTADGKRRVFTALPYPPYDEGDLWVNATYPAGITAADRDPANDRYHNDILRCNSCRASGAFDIGDWELSSNYTDDSLAQEAIENIKGYEYLKESIVNGASQAIGGLFLSSHIRLGQWDKSNPDNPVMSKVWAGMNGLPLDSRSIASWWGGDMADLFDRNDNPLVPAPANAATALVRMDGSAYFANGNIGFNADGSGWLGNKTDGITFSPGGRMTFGSGVVFDVSNVGGLQDTLNSIGNAVVALDTLFVPCDAAGKPLKWEEALQTDNAGGYRAKSLKAAVGVWSDQYVSGKGLGAAPGGSGGGGAAYDRLDAWGDYSAAKAGWVLSAALGHDLHTRLQNVYGKPAIDSMLAGFVTLATRQTIRGSKTFGDPIITCDTHGPWLTGKTSAAIMFNGLAAIDSQNAWYMYNMKSAGGHVLAFGGLSNNIGFYTFLSSQTDNGYNSSFVCDTASGQWWTNKPFHAASFIKDGGTASQVLMADGSVASKVAMTAVSHLGWTSNAAAALLIPTMSALALWDGRYNAAGSNLQYCDRGRFGDIVTHGHGEYVTALGISGDNITWTRNGATNSIAVPYAAESSRMRVADIRDITMTPAAFNSKTVTAWFNQTGTPSSIWYAGITVKGWTDGYAAWQLCANSTVNTADTNLYFRIGINSSFQAWQKILTDANYASMLDGRYVNTAGDEMTGDLAVRKLHLQGGNEFNCDDKLWIAFRSTPQGVNVCHADQPFTYGSAGHEVLHRGNYTNLVNTLAQPLTIRCGNDAKLIFDNTDGERYTRLSFREAGTEYAGITANSEAFIFSGKPVSAPYFKAEYTTLCPNLNADLLDGLHLSRTPAANAVPAYDADTMLPVSAGLKMQNDKMAELSSPGWYRVFSSHSADAARASLLLFLGRNYNHTNNENYVFSISLGCGAGVAGYRPTVTQLSGRAVGQIIPKIRVLQKWNSVYHVDIYYSGTVANGVYSFGIGPGRFAAPVAAAIPDGYTSYEFGTVPNGFRCDGIAETTDLRLSRYLFFKHSGANNGIYLSPSPDGSLNISAHSGYSYTKSLGIISYGGNFGIGTTLPQWPLDVHGSVHCDDWFRTTGNGGWYSQTHGGGMYMRNSTWVEAYNKPVKIAHRTAIGPSGFGVGLQLRDSNHTGIEVCGGNTTMGMGCHRDGRWCWWRGTTNPDASSDKACVMNFDGGTWDFKGRLHATGAVYSDTAIGGKGLPSTSDKRLKTIVADVVLPLDTVAGAPLKSFFWNDGKDMAARCGTVAQYWERLLPEVVYKQPDGYLAVDYGALAHAEAVTVARELVRLRQRVEALEHENRKLKRITGNA